ncbi:hypothetical protein [Polyangium sp. y55x31]|uniref:hypothetical protein n=1 Tax=Polyangium sp. y55x31 TaxID=3042688 RepID=UPI0024825820|nr:hypothetical protein [Polyangium sp. y55x31]MDI1477966.1 hypothetical protein [Polyangium sp. y55x31]
MNTPAPPRFRIRLFLERLAVGHFFGYPLAFVWAVASMPLTIHLHFERLSLIEHDTEAMGQLVVRLVAWPAGVVFVLSHLFAIAWGLAQEKKRGQWVFFGGFGVILGAGVLFGAGSWLWLYLR